MSSDQLPKFKNPPVVETVLGVQFDPLPKAKLSNAHLGAFWRSLGKDWPSVTDAPSLDPQFERFEEGMAWQPVGLGLRLTQELSLRLQIRKASENRMIQVQNGRFHFNWLGHGGEDYPRYEKVKPEFDRALDAFRQFLEEESQEVLQPNQWEVTYVNHIPKGTVWESEKDWAGLFHALGTLPEGEAPIRLEDFGGEWHYENAPAQAA